MKRIRKNCFLRILPSSDNKTKFEIDLESD